MRNRSRLLWQFMIIGTAAHGVNPLQTSAATLLLPQYSDSLIADIPETTVGYGGLTVDNDGSLLVTSNGPIKVSRVSAAGDVQTLASASVSSEDLYDVTRISADTYLVTSRWRPQFYTLNVTGGELVPLTVLQDTRNPLSAELAPPSFGSFGGKAVYSTFALYGVEAIDLNSLVVSPVAEVDYLSDIEFSADGRLFGVSFLENIVVEVHANGSISTLAHLPDSPPTSTQSQPDGMAIHPVTGKIYVAEPSSQRIFEVDLSGDVTVFATDMEFDSGFAVSGMAFSKDGQTLYYLSGDDSQSVRAISGFPAIPEPGTTWSYIVVITALNCSRRSRQR